MTSEIKPEDVKLPEPKFWHDEQAAHPDGGGMVVIRHPVFTASS